mgnify:CR=1 FL=1
MVVDVGNRCRLCGSAEHGKPFVVGHPDLAVSSSTAGHLTLVALTTAGALGVDIEEVAATDFEGFDDVALEPSECAHLDGLTAQPLLHARARLWTRKEAILKATGHGLAIDPRSVQVTGPDEPPALAAWTAATPAPSPVRLADIVLPGEAYAASVAVLTAEPLVLRQV